MIYEDFTDTDRRQKDRYNVEYVFVPEYMQVQAFEGYWENGRFYPLEQVVSQAGRLRKSLKA